MSELNYVGELKRNMPAILFIPGALTSPCVFEGLANYLPFQSAVIDWNTSQCPNEVTTIAQHVLELIEKRNLSPVILCGYSMGGVISLSAAIQDKKHLISALYIADTGANTKGHGDPDFPQKLLESWPSEELFNNFLARCFATPISKPLYDRLFEYALALDGNAVYQAAKSVRTVDLLDRLGEISCPVMLIHGRKDMSRTEQHAKELIAGIPNAKMVWFDCGHTPMVEERERYLSELLQFIKSLEIAPLSCFDAISVR